MVYYEKGGVIEVTKAKVVIFTTTHCPWCRAAKEYLRQKGVNFYEINVERDPKAAQDLIRLTGQTGVPVILINNRPIVGFNRPLIDQLLKQYEA